MHAEPGEAGASQTEAEAEVEEGVLVSEVTDELLCTDTSLSRAWPVALSLAAPRFRSMRCTTAVPCL